MNQPAVVQGRQKPANTNAAQPRPSKASASARPSSGAPKSAKHTHEKRPSQRDQLEVERIEHLHLIEAFIGAAMTHVMREGFDSPEEWPALIQRSEGNRVQAPEAVVDQVVELIAGLCNTLDTEIRAALGLPADAPRRKYRLLPRRSKRGFDNGLWLSDDEPATRAADATPPATSPATALPNQTKDQ